MQNKLLLLIGFIGAIANYSFSQTHNLTNSIAAKGYDVVSYFKEIKAVKGDLKYSTTIDNVTYYFSSNDNKNEFLQNPKKYEPQYGGWCAYALGKNGEKVDINPETFKIVDGKLYLFYNAYFNNTLKKWNKDETNLRKQADNNYKSISN